MKNVLSYKVKINYIKIDENENFELIFSEKLFIDENPINARIKAFNFYQNWIDVLLDSINKPYQNDQQAREDLSNYFDTFVNKEVLIENEKIIISNTSDFGIGVYYVINEPLVSKVLEHSNKEMKKILEQFDDKINDELLIHGIGYLGNPVKFMQNLYDEYNYYIEYNLDKQNLTNTVKFYEYEIGETEYNEILITPLDWEDYYINCSKWPENYVPYQTTNHERINNGESNQVEFKPSLLYNYKTQQASIGIKNIIAKAICSFLNSNGGILYIGVSNDKKIIGLNDDFSLANGKDPNDFFLLQFDDMIKQFFSFSVKSNINAYFQNIDDKQIFVVIVEPSKRKPIFLKGQFGKEFYVRGEASTRKIEDIEEIIDYCLEHWNNLQNN